MHDRHGRRLIAWAIALACASADLVHAAPPTEPVACDPSSGECPEPEPQTAAEWYARGYELGTAGDYEAAAAAFLRSYELQPTAEALFNAALAHEQAGATIDAITTYERFLAEPSPPRDLVDAAHLSIETLLSKVAVLKGLRYTAQQAPAEVYIDGESIELDPFVPRLMLPGEIEIEVVAQSGERASESYELEAGEALIIDLRGLLPPPFEPPPPEIEVEGPSAEEREEVRRAYVRRTATLRKVTWVGLGLTSASVVSTITLGALTAHAKSQYDKFTCFQFEGSICPTDFKIDDVQGHLQAYERYLPAVGILAGVSGGVGIATLVVGLVVVRRSKRTPAPTVSIVPTAGGVAIAF